MQYDSLWLVKFVAGRLYHFKQRGFVVNLHRTDAINAKGMTSGAQDDQGTGG
jgi:hypothetical protein